MDINTRPQQDLRYHATRLNAKGVFAGVGWRYLKGWPGKNNKPR
jgi:hypothetical protein